MENTALASTLHTGGCLKNGTPLMWWLHGLRLKLCFRKKKECAFPLCFFPSFIPISFSMVAYMINCVFFS